MARHLGMTIVKCNYVYYVYKFRFLKPDSPRLSSKVCGTEFSCNCSNMEATKEAETLFDVQTLILFHLHLAFTS